jgi:hypothetical protein
MLFKEVWIVAFTARQPIQNTQIRREGRTQSLTPKQAVHMDTTGSSKLRRVCLARGYTRVHLTITDKKEGNSGIVQPALLSYLCVILTHHQQANKNLYQSQIILGLK